MDVNGILLLYFHPLFLSAPTLTENIHSFARESEFKVWEVNTLFGFPEGLEGLRFRCVVLHYSLFDPWGYRLCERFLSYLERSPSSYKVAFFQDEYHYCRQRFAFLNRYKIDCVYTLVEPAYFKDVYRKYTSVPKLIYHIPGYVSDDLVATAKRLTRPEERRTIDIGYRGQRLPFYMGKGAQEKFEIAAAFRERVRGSGLKTDIEADPSKRIYGPAWYEFLANCRAVLGVEAGVSVYDIDDVVRAEWERLSAENPDITFEELSRRLLCRWESNIPYRTISPRHFEAAALRVCQILFEGKYSGVMQPMVHYIALRKDFSNFEEVIGLIRDEGLRREMTERAYRDLIASGRYSYRSFVRGFDEELRQSAAISPDVSSKEAARVTSLLRKGGARRYVRAWAEHKRVMRWVGVVRGYPFPGRETLKSVLKGQKRRPGDETPAGRP
jgi:hypothetical protein